MKKLSAVLCVIFLIFVVGGIINAASPCRGDFHSDGDVDGLDLAVFAEDLGRMECDIAPVCEGDFDGDNYVADSDLAVFAADFGRTDCPIGTVEAPIVIPPPTFDPGESGTFDQGQFDKAAFE